MPTIAVATDGGLSVIKDDGTVVNGGEANSGWTVMRISIDASGNVWGIHSNNWSAGAQLLTSPPYADVADIGSGTQGYQLTDQMSTSYGRNTSWPFILGNFYSNNPLSKSNDGFTVGGSKGATFVDDNVDRTKSMVSYVSSDYNTGWMNGDIKLATLSDTDDTDVVGSELVTNGTFSSNVSGWTAQNAVISWDSNGYIVVDDTADAGGDSQAYQNITTVAGKRYTLSVQGISTTTNFWLAVGDGTAYQNIYYSGSLGNTPKIFTHTFTASSTSTKIALISSGAGVTKYDNISVRLAEPDRSVNGNGLQVHGTIQKNPVATGADLVGYGGFSSSNYLKQPYNSDLDFGTGDFNVMFWIKTTDTYYTLIDRRMGENGYTGGQSFAITTTAAGSTSMIRFFIGSNFYDSTELPEIVSGSWTNVCVVRNGDILTFYVNGENKGSVSGVGSNSATSTNQSFTKIGARHDGAQTLTGSLALLRISATAPTAEQIAKIYRDEKPLFQEDAKATLYGTSDAVTALAYDDDTELLHVGTSAGRSVFKGLQRVDNTTDAVGTAISASNNLVVED